MSCLPDCNRDYNTNVKECPCQENCPNGCPCPNYSCQGTTSPSITTTTLPTTTTMTTTKATTTTTPLVQNKTVLVLNSKDGWKPALLINSSGRQDEVSCFTHDTNTEAYLSCSLVWDNELYIFGSSSNRRQISKLVQYNLKIVGSLPFDFRSGACTNMAGHKLFLCFHYSSSEYKRCRWTTNPLDSFENVTESTFNHDQIRISSSECK